jgi:hypothetical protein
MKIVNLRWLYPKQRAGRNGQHVWPRGKIQREPFVSHHIHGLITKHYAQIPKLQPMGTDRRGFNSDVKAHITCRCYIQIAKISIFFGGTKAPLGPLSLLDGFRVSIEFASYILQGSLKSNNICGVGTGRRYS